MRSGRLWRLEVDPYENLANAIIMRAVEDYRLAEDRRTLKEIEGFFLSDWFSVLTNLDGAALLQKLREEKTI